MCTGYGGSLWLDPYFYFSSVYTCEGCGFVAAMLREEKIKSYSLLTLKGLLLHLASGWRTHKLSMSGDTVLKKVSENDYLLVAYYYAGICRRSINKICSMWQLIV